LPTIDVVERLILVPGRTLPGAWLFGKHMIVKNPGGATSHEQRSRFPNSCLENELAIVVILLPVAKVLDEPTWIVRAARDLRAWAGVREIVVDTCSQPVDVLGLEQRLQADSAVTLEGLNVGRGDHGSNPFNGYV
jgi:hypothetical protein